MINIATAIESNNIEQVRDVINSGFKFTASNSPLGLAAKLGHLEIVKLLLDSGCKVEWGGHVEPSPLYHAAFKGHIEVVKFLIERKANLDYKDEEGWTPLMTASAMGFIEVVKLLVDAGAKINIVSEHGDFALLSAATNGHTEIYQYLLPLSSSKLVKQVKNSSATFESGKPKAKPSKELTKLINAIGNASFVKSEKDSTEIQLVAKAISKIVDFQEVDLDGRTVIHYSVDNIEITRLLLENGFSPAINIQDKRGDTPLIIACIHNKLEVVPILLTSGANTELKNSKGYTALISTVEFTESKEIIQLLFDTDANIEAQDKFGNTAIDIIYAKSKDIFNDFPEDSLEIIDFLISLGASTERFVEIDFIFNAGNGENESVIQFIRNGGNIGCYGREGISALSEAARNDKPETVRILLDHGASIDNIIETFANCCAKGNIEVVQELINAGVDINSPLPNKNAFAISRAVENKQIAIVDLLLKSGAKVPKNDPIWGDLVKYAKIRDLEMYKLFMKR
jgi:ankyrin repeat protein